MTREEAIDEIKRWTPILLVSGQCTEKTSKAQDMAISALSAEGDLISRQAVLELTEHLEADFANSFDPHTLAEIYRRVKELPSVENKGEWIIDKEQLGYWISTCSVCGHIFHGNEVLIYKPKFCSNCGARMKGGG